MATLRFSLLCLLALSACAKTTPEAGSQTHFLDCEHDQDCESLGSGFSCEEGVCREQDESTTSAGSKAPPPSAGSNAPPSAGSTAPPSAGSSSPPQAGSTAPMPDPLCDGSDDVRFGYDTSGGFIDTIQEFYLRIGYFFFYVQGNCHFIVSRTPTGEIREGDLDPARAEQLANDVRFAMLPSWRTFADNESCPDAGEVRLLGPSGPVTCTCGCGESAPDGMDEAFAAASMSLTELWELGRPLAGAVSAVAYVPTENSSDWSGNLEAQDWPLASSIDELSVVERNRINRDSGLRFEGADGEALRMLRTQALMQSEYASSFPVRDADGDTFGLLVRDELPTELQDAVEAFR